jgi:tetratricopeptide (TPR) repeat protein
MLLSEAYLNLEEKDSALIRLKIAEKFTKQNKEKSRYRFILGQLYEELGKKDSAIYRYESVIDMNRKSERKYVIQALESAVV